MAFGTQSSVPHYRALKRNDGADNIGYDNGATGSVKRYAGDKFREFLSVSDFGAVGDGSDETTKIQAAIDSLPAKGGTLIFPAPVSYYLVSSTLSLKKRVVLAGRSKYGCQINFSGGVDNLFEFVGGSEAEDCNIIIKYLDLVSITTKTGTAIRARNFTGVTVKDCSIYNFDKGIHTDWGIGLYAYKNNITSNTRGIQIGGDITETGMSAGIRGTGNRFMDTVHLSNNIFSSNTIDVSDSGSIDSLGGLYIDGGSCFESSVSPVAGKVTNIRIAGRKNFYVNNVWFENPENNRTGIILSNYDYDGVLQDVPNGKIESNYFLMNGGASTIGVDVQRGFVSIAGENTFNHLGGGRAISLGDTSSPSEVGQNVYLGTYTSSEPISQASEIHQILDPSRNSQLQSISIGGSGGEITKTLKGSASLIFGVPPSVPGNSDQTITVVGAAIGDMVTVGSNATLEANRVLTAFVSAADTVTVRFTQLSGTPAVPVGSGGTFKVFVFKT
jgi:hypothetical protein